jgi:hypothetical protein
MCVEKMKAGSFPHSLQRKQRVEITINPRLQSWETNAEGIPAETDLSVFDTQSIFLSNPLVFFCKTYLLVMFFLIFIPTKSQQYNR